MTVEESRSPSAIALEEIATSLESERDQISAYMMMGMFPRGAIKATVTANSAMIDVRTLLDYLSRLSAGARKALSDE